MEKEKNRSEISEQFKWDLSSMYSSDEEIENDKKKLLDLINKIESYKGTIASSSTILYNFLKLQENIMLILTNLYVYAYCKKSVDVSDQSSQKLYNEISNLDTLYNEKASFVMPELMKTKYDTIKKYIDSDDKLKEFEFDLESVYRYQKYTLNDSEEALLSNISELRQKFENNFEMIVNSIINYGYIEDENGNKVQLTNGNFQKYIRSSDRRVRKDAYETRGNILKDFTKLIAIDYEAVLRADSIEAKLRGYNSDIDMYLYDDGVTPEIYDNLIFVANKNINSLYKYYKLIKNISKIDDLQVYDLSVPLTAVSEKKYTPNDARKTIVEALQILGDEYVSILNKAFDERWIDFYPNKGKRAGYYENSSYIGNPVVFGNYNDDFPSVSSICHELGHAVHSYFSNKNNPAHLSSYKIFVAEVASLTNEILLSNYIVKNSQSKQEKLLAIENILDVFSNNFFGTLAEGSIFERKVHEKVYNGEVLTEKEFNQIYDEISDTYYGTIVNKHEFVKYNWARIPHFYTSFYYYKYSIGVSCACFIAKKILNGDKEYLNKYLKFLTLGGSMMPLDELKTIGIDLTKTDVIEEAINYFDNLIDEFEKIYNQ